MRNTHRRRHPPCIIDRWTKDLKNVLPMICLGFGRYSPQAPPPFHSSRVRLGWTPRILSLGT